MFRNKSTGSKAVDILNSLDKIVKDREVWRAAVHGVAELDMTEGLNNSCIAGRFFFTI